MRDIELNIILFFALWGICRVTMQIIKISKVEKNGTRISGQMILLVMFAALSMAAACEKQTPPVQPSPTPAPQTSPSPILKPSPSPEPSPTPEATVEPSATPTASASSTPATCACLVRWAMNSDPYVKLDKNHQLTDKIELDGWVFFDTTERFATRQGDTRGIACDHDTTGNCMARGCEDPRGPEFTYAGPSKGEVNSNVFQFKIGPIKSGHHQIKASPRSDLMDSLGEPVKVCPWISDPSTTSSFSL